jgi:hypothetical protein
MKAIAASLSYHIGEKGYDTSMVDEAVMTFRRRSMYGRFAFGQRADDLA